MHGRIAPSLIEEATRSIQVLKVIHIRPTPPEPKIANLKVRPEMAGRVSIRLILILRPPLPVCQPLHSIIRVHIGRMICNEFLRLRPECRHTLRRVVDIDVEAICFVVILHPAEDVVVDVAEEVDVRFDAPVVLVFGEGGVLGEEAAVPTTHLVIGLLFHVLDALVDEEGHGFGVEVWVDPGRDGPVFLGNELCEEMNMSVGHFCMRYRVCIRTISYLRISSCPRLLLELL